jgi:formylmethanofuran dehydrogenase subunit E
MKNQTNKQRKKYFISESIFELIDNNKTFSLFFKYDNSFSLKEETKGKKKNLNYFNLSHKGLTAQKPNTEFKRNDNGVIKSENRQQIKAKELLCLFDEFEELVSYQKNLLRKKITTIIKNKKHRGEEFVYTPNYIQNFYKNLILTELNAVFKKTSFEIIDNENEMQQLYKNIDSCMSSESEETASYYKRLNAQILTNKERNCRAIFWKIDCFTKKSKEIIFNHFGEIKGVVDRIYKKEANIQDYCRDNKILYKKLNTYDNHIYTNGVVELDFAKAGISIKGVIDYGDWFAWMDTFATYNDGYLTAGGHDLQQAGGGFYESNVCTVCGEPIYNEDVVYINGEPYCLHCVSYCSSCDEYVLDGDINKVGNDYICDDCLHRYYTRCNDCGEYYHNDETKGVAGGYDVCLDCLNDYYYYCNDCGEYYKFEDITEYNGEYYCNDCLESIKEKELEETETI